MSSKENTSAMSRFRCQKLTSSVSVSRNGGAEGCGGAGRATMVTVSPVVSRPIHWRCIPLTPMAPGGRRRVSSCLAMHYGSRRGKDGRNPLDCQRKFALNKYVRSVREIGRVHNKTVG